MKNCGQPSTDCRSAEADLVNRGFRPLRWPTEYTIGRVVERQHRPGDLAEANGENTQGKAVVNAPVVPDRLGEGLDRGATEVEAVRATAFHARLALVVH